MSVSEMQTVADMGGGGLFEMLTSACILQNQGFFALNMPKNSCNLLGFF